MAVTIKTSATTVAMATAVENDPAPDLANTAVAAVAINPDTMTLASAPAPTASEPITVTTPCNARPPHRYTPPTRLQLGLATRSSQHLLPPRYTSSFA